jgi:Trk K+ transport system NAD-binding subunit
MDAQTHLTARGTRDLLRPLVWRVLAFVLVYLTAVVALSAGVGVSQRDLTGAGIGERAYYALGLFVLGGLDIGIPEGGPLFGRSLLWSAYFLAPAITVSALLETAIRLVGPLALRVRPLSGHVVIGGGGRLALLYVRKLRQRDRRKTVVVVERDPRAPFLTELREVHRALVVIGDVASDTVLRGLRMKRAHRVLLLTGDDFANLDAAAKILRHAPRLAHGIVVHVSDLGFMRQTAGSSVARDCEVFNGHEFAAIHLVRDHLGAHFRSTPNRDLVVLAGFGRFGQTVLDQLQKHALGSFGRVVIIDENASRHSRAFADGPGFAHDYERLLIEGDIRDPEIWSRIAEIVHEHGHDPVVVLGSGHDGTNLHAALRVRDQHPGAYVIVRSFRSSPFAEEVADEAGAHAFNLGGLIESGMPERWF